MVLNNIKNVQAKALKVDAEFNAICDFILEAADWAAELSTVPPEQRQIVGISKLDFFEKFHHR